MGTISESGKPLFFRVANPDDLGLSAPSMRLGEALRTQVRSLGGMQKEALVVSQRTGAVWRLTSDEGAYLDGDDEAPCPLSFLTTGMVCSYMEEILALARARGIEIENIRLVQDNFYTMRGSALRGTMTGGARDVELEAQIASAAGRDELVELIHDATAGSPLNGLLRRSLPSVFSLAHNGHPAGCGRVACMTSPGPGALDDAGFDRARPALGDFSPTIRRGGPSPKTEETTGFASSSLAEQQDRILHVRGICTQHEDGIKRVEQQLFNPHGSVFEFLCDEAPENGGRGLAPDALSYVSAGIAFCFMTQLGRYAAIARKNLGDHRIVQDTHFSLGGASHGTGRTGAAEPVETHLSMATGEDDDFARRALDMSEQTCFLHALCRSELKTKVRVREFPG